MKKFEYEGAPLGLAFVLGPMAEVNLRKSLIMSGGSVLIFFARPLSALFHIMAIGLLIFSLIPGLEKSETRLGRWRNRVDLYICSRMPIRPALALNKSFLRYLAALPGFFSLIALRISLWQAKASAGSYVPNFRSRI